LFSFRSIAITLIFLTALSYSQNRICITVDDLPFVPYGANDSAWQTANTEKLLGSFTKHHVPIIGFVNEGKLYENNILVTWRIHLLEKWLDGGYELGNHTFSHCNFNKISFADYIDDIVKGEYVLTNLLTARNKQLKYFRHPFLYVGATLDRADSLAHFLAGRNYTVAPVTIDNDDYMFAVSYHKALQNKDTLQADSIGRDYVIYLEKKVLYYAQESTRLFGRNINQILLMHASKLNADYADTLMQIFAKDGYTFITLKEALTDSAYSTPVTVPVKWGISWLDRWALSAGKKKDFFKDEPDVPEYIKNMYDKLY
jgi:peptidoglycan/xylan/chitin deacetylase (PgdA/CDA1 family)